MRLLTAFLALLAFAGPAFAAEEPAAPWQWLACKTSDDCVLTNYDCCSQKAVNKVHADLAYKKWNSADCQLQQCAAPPKPLKAVCQNMQCTKIESP